MLRKPSRKNYKYEFTRPNLIPILDAVFIFIFFLLLSANFLKVYEINSNVPTISSEPPPNDQKPLNLGLKIYDNKINIYTGVPWQLLKTINKNSNDKFDLNLLHDYLIAVKKQNLNERTITFEPVDSIEYETLVEIMDAARAFKTTDPSFYKTTKDGMDQKVEILFDDIIFGNIKS